MAFLTVKNIDETIYKINLNNIDNVQLREGYICIAFSKDYIEINDSECTNFAEVEKKLKDL